MGRKEKKYHFIYKTIDTRNENFYIGMHSTDNLNDGYIGSGDRLKKLIYKHGKDIFKMEILEFLPNRKSLREREEELVNSDLIKEEKCMNLRVGGEGGFHSTEAARKGAKVTNEKYKDKKREWAIKASKKRLKNFGSPNPKGHIFYDWSGKKHSEESKNKMSLSASKRRPEQNSQFGTMWITNGEQNKKIKKEENIPLGWFKGRKIK